MNKEFRPIFVWDSKEVLVKGDKTIIQMSAGKISFGELKETIELIRGKGRKVILKQDKIFKNSFRVSDKETGILIGSFRRRVDALDVCRRNDWKVKTDLTNCTNKGICNIGYACDACPFNQINIKKKE